MISSRPMRGLGVLPLLSALVLGQEPAAPANDELGFPITFNETVLTRSDVLRGLPPAETLASGAEVKKQRDRLLMERLTETLGRRQGIVIEERDVKDEVERQMTRLGGEAKFYEYLSETGQTLEGFRENIRLQILQAHISYMFVQGYTPGGRKMLEWSPVPTPREIATAYRNDPERQSGLVRLKVYEMVLDIDAAERRQLLAQQVLGTKPKEWLQEQIAQKLAPVLVAVRATLDGGEPFAAVAARHGAPTAGQNPRWLEMPKGEPRDEVDRFLQQAAAGARSEPLEMPLGGYRLLFVEELERPGDLPPNDPGVVAAYRERIQDLRRRKAEALLRIRTLDDSTVRPERVAQEFRATLLAGLREAETALRALGVH